MHTCLMSTHQTSPPITPRLYIQTLPRRTTIFLPRDLSKISAIQKIPMSKFSSMHSQSVVALPSFYHLLMFTHINNFFLRLSKSSNYDYSGPQKPPKKPPKPAQYRKVIISSDTTDQEGLAGTIRLSHGKTYSHGAITHNPSASIPEPYILQPTRGDRQNRNSMPAMSLETAINGDVLDRRPSLHPQGPRRPPSNSGFSARFSTAVSPAASNSSSYSPVSAVNPYASYNPRDSIRSNSSIESAHSYSLMHVNPAASNRMQQSNYLSTDDMDDPYKHQDKSPSPIPLVSTDSLLTTSRAPYYPEPPISPLLNRRPTSDQHQRNSGPISPGASSLSSSGFQSRSTNTQYSDSYEVDHSPLRTSGEKLLYFEESRAPTQNSVPYPITPPPRSPTKASIPSYPNPAYSDPLSSFSKSQNSPYAIDPTLDLGSKPVIKDHAIRENPGSLNIWRPPLKINTDVESVNSSETFKNAPRSQSTIVHDGRLNLPSRSYTVGSRSHSGSGPTIGPASLRSSSYSTADDSLMLRLDLPAIPDSKVQFDASKLSSRDFEQCQSPWLISSLSTWIRFYATQRDITFEELSEALIGLFRHTIPTLGWVAAERVTVPLLESLTSQMFLSIDNETGLILVDGSVFPTGVLPMLTGKGCYSSKAHAYDESDSSCANYRCYSSRCWRSLPYKAVLPEIEKALRMDDSDRLHWAKLWGVSDEELGKLDKKVIERQSTIQELIATEESYVRGLKVFLTVYGESLARSRPPIFPQQKKFWDNTFGCIQGLIDCNGAQFLSHLKARQSQQGPYVENIADLILNWLKIARGPYLNRASTYSFSSRALTLEKSKNDKFMQWLETVEHDPRVSRQQKFDFLIQSPLTRLCKYNLLFGRLKASTSPENPDYELLDRCMEECKSILSEYNSRHGEAEDLSSILTLDEKIQFRSAEEKVDLRLSEGRRKIVYESDVLRKGEFGIDFVGTHMILLDHYLIMAKVRKEHKDKFLVSKKVRFYFYCWLI